MRSSLIADVARLAAVILLLAGAARGQVREDRDAQLADRPIAELRIEGASEADEQLVRNNIRASVGDPYDGETVRRDVARIYDLGRFMLVTADATLLEQGGVVVTYQMTPQPVIRAVQTIGNKAITDQELRGVIRQVPGGPRDQYLIEKAKRDIRSLYRAKGFYLTEVAVDESELEERGLLIFEVIEGPRVRVKAIVFEGVEAFRPRRLQAEIKMKPHVALFRAGVLDEELIADDKATLDGYYRDRGFLDVRVGHTVALSPDNTEAKVTFQVVEGRRFTLGSVRAMRVSPPDAPLTVFTPEQLAALLEVKTGDVYSVEKLRDSIQNVRDAYGQLGYLDVQVDADEYRRPPPDAEVDLVLTIAEGQRYRVGLITINGNFLTKDKVIRRLLGLRPGRPYDTAELDRSERRIRQTRLFNDVRITLQSPATDDPLHRDLLVEVKESDTGSVNFGLAVGSDQGVFGEFSLVQRNFDIADPPETMRELITGRAFRGAGQQFALTFRPGDEIFEYSASLTEPHIFETDVSMSVVGSARQRVYEQYDEERLTGSIGLARRLGDVWKVGLRGRSERVELSDIELDAPVDVFEAAGPDTLSALGVTLSRTTVGTLTRPGRGSNLEISLDGFGVFGGEFSFFNAQAEYTVFLTIDEDFLGRRSTLKLNGRVGHIFGDDRPPIYERFFLGGRTLRGFDFRQVSPKGIRADTGLLGDDPVGGEWLVFLGAQYEFPLFQEAISGVFFADSGTVTNDVGLDDYRVSVGGGLRLYIPALGPVPIAFDFGFPVSKEPGDQTRTFTFTAELPF